MAASETMLPALTLALSGSLAMEHLNVVLWAACCKLLGGNMGQLVIRVEVVRMAPTQQSQTLTSFYHVGLGRANRQGHISPSNAAT